MPLQVPLHDLHVKHNARLVPFAGYLMPLQYEKGILAEHQQVRQSCGIFDVSHMGAVFIKGEGCGEALNKIIPADLTTLPLHKVRYGLLLTDEGTVVDDLLVTRWEDGYQLVLNAGCKHTDLAYIKQNLPPHLTITTAFENVMLAVQGPKACDVVGTLCPDAVRLNFMEAGRFDILGMSVIVSRTGYTGEDGFELLIPPHEAEKIAVALLAQESVSLIGLGARDSLRLEAGLCLYGHELDEKTSPIEASLTWAIGKETRLMSDFKGSTRILKEIKDGPARRRIGLILQDRAVAREGAKVFDGDGNEIGVVTSGVHSPTLNRPIAMASIRADANQTGIQIMIRDQLRTTEVVKLPFVPTNYYKG